MKTNQTENEIGQVVVDCAVRLHRELGPGLLESVYEATLARALEKRGLATRRQIPIPIRFDGESFDEGFRADLLVADRVLLELKSVEKIAPVHKKQVLTYLRLGGFRLGFLLNFGSELMRDGIVRVINGRLE
ncbi:MAG: GxxExxY protein [Opitutales bacterium]|nr:GxxExxY protein [Opitutales bacterium]